MNLHNCERGEAIQSLSAEGFWIAMMGERAGTTFIAAAADEASIPTA